MVVIESDRHQIDIKFPAICHPVLISINAERIGGCFVPLFRNRITYVTMIDKILRNKKFVQARINAGIGL